MGRCFKKIIIIETNETCGTYRKITVGNKHGGGVKKLKRIVERDTFKEMVQEAKTQTWAEFGGVVV